MPQTLNIAVCEDEAAETVLLCDILNHSDIQNTYTVFTDADSFLASYEYGKYDLLLMDIYMKDSMTGICLADYGDCLYAGHGIFHVHRAESQADFHTFKRK